MVTFHTIIEHLKKFPLKGDEGIMVLATDEKAVSYSCRFKSKLDFLSTLVIFLRNNPELLELFSDVVKLASNPCKDKKERVQ